MRFDRYTFEVESGPALDISGSCEVILTDCTVRGTTGIRASERAVVTMHGGSLTANGAAVNASDDARVSFDGTRVSGAIQTSGAATVTGAGDAGR